MRIRGNARIADIMDLDGIAPAYPPEMLQTHVCELNQSPWDVLTFPSDSIFSFPPENRFQGDDSLTANNGSIGDSIGAVESRRLLPDDDEDEDEDEDEDDEEATNPPTAKTRTADEIASTKNKTILSCNKSDGKGWQCRKAAKEGHALCEHHLAQLRSYNTSNQSSSRKLDKPAAASDRTSARRRPRALKKPPSNPNEFYYYSGFGPLWGKKRGGSKPESNRNVHLLKPESPPSYSSQIDSPDDPDQKIEEEYDHDDDDDDDEEDSDDDHDIVDGEDNGDGAKKRSRKPVKARSLKSLM